jgi:hypothetical protein
MQVRIKKLQRSLSNIPVQFRSIYAGGVNTRFGIVIPPELVALIIEDFVAYRTR